MARVTRVIDHAIGVFRGEADAIGDAERRLTPGQLLSLLPGVALIGVGAWWLQRAGRRQRSASAFASLLAHEREHHEALEAISP